jgi:hypothetical protein
MTKFHGILNKIRHPHLEGFEIHIHNPGHTSEFL